MRVGLVFDNESQSAVIQLQMTQREYAVRMLKQCFAEETAGSFSRLVDAFTYLEYITEEEALRLEHESPFDVWGE